MNLCSIDMELVSRGFQRDPQKGPLDPTGRTTYVSRLVAVA